ncbi:hypothetical protein CNYM01_14349, partial [Colletotrichum nymphaeae SA-01]
MAARSRRTRHRSGRTHRIDPPSSVRRPAASRSCRGSGTLAPGGRGSSPATRRWASSRRSQCPSRPEGLGVALQEKGRPPLAARSRTGCWPL